MDPDRILLPLDIADWPIEAFRVVSRFAQRPGVTIILLHVVNLNIAMSENRLLDELAGEARASLERLAQEYLPPSTATLIRVRHGEPAGEILAAAKEESADLIVVPMRRAPLWRRLFPAWFPGTVVKLIRHPPCGLFVLEVMTHFNCQKIWGRAAEKPTPASDRDTKPAPRTPEPRHPLSLGHPPPQS